MFAHIMSIIFWHTITYIMVIWQVQLKHYCSLFKQLLIYFWNSSKVWDYLKPILTSYIDIPTHMNQYKIAIITRVEQLWQVEAVAWPCCKRRLVCDQTCHSPNSPCIEINTHIQGVCSEPISLYSIHWEGTSWWGSYMCIANYT